MKFSLAFLLLFTLLSGYAVFAAPGANSQHAAVEDDYDDGNDDDGDTFEAPYTLINFCPNFCLFFILLPKKM